MKEFQHIPLNEEPQIGYARRSVRRYARDAGLAERQLAEVDICLDEIGTNAIKYARGTGHLYFSSGGDGSAPPGLEIVYVDKGPGIVDLEQALEDGFTTSGSMGTGLGALRRLSDEFHIYSQVPSATKPLSFYGRTTHGTAIVLRKYLEGAGAPPRGAREAWGVFSRPHPEEKVNGDGYLLIQGGSRTLAAVVDGLGHGEGAREAALATLAYVEKNAGLPVDAIMYGASEEIRSTRGAVAGIASIDPAKGVIEYTGVGNTDISVLGGAKPLRLISVNGMLGGTMPKLRVFREKLPGAAIVLMSTDGISERWDISAYAGLQALHPQLICAVLARDFGRPRDDATILCGRVRA